MKPISASVAGCTLWLVLLGGLAQGQGTFIYDQQSADESFSGGAAGAIQPNQPLGQSFTPTNSAVGFIRLFLGDSAANGLGATLVVQLRTNSVSGTILATTSPVSLPDSFGGYVNFFFPTPVTVTPGAPYFFRPEVSSGDTWGIVSYSYGYPGGMAFSKGLAAPAIDFWFREGIYVPEPGTWALLLVGLSALAWRRGKFR